MLYDIKQPDGNIVEAEPEVGAWYCHFIVIDAYDGVQHRDGNIAQYQGEGVWTDEDGFEVGMFVDEYEDYIVKQG